MGIIKREDKWRLEKKQEGVYIISERKSPKAKVITSEYEPDNELNDERADLSVVVTEVENFDDVKKEFQSYKEKF